MIRPSTTLRQADLLTLALKSQALCNIIPSRSTLTQHTPLMMQPTYPLGKRPHTLPPPRPINQRRCTNLLLSRAQPALYLIPLTLVVEAIRHTTLLEVPLIPTPHRSIDKFIVPMMNYEG